MTTTIFFIVISISFIVYQRQKERNWVNHISLLMAPYIPLVFLNNFYIYKFGFDRIMDEVLLVILFSFLFFFLGSLLFPSPPISRTLYDNQQKLNKYDISKIRKFLTFVGVLGMLKILYLFKQGTFTDTFDEAEGVMGNGLIGHLILASNSLFPIYFYYWLKNKGIWNLIPLLLIIVVVFSSFIKYNVMGLVVSTFIFLMIYEKRVLKKALIVLVLFILFLFVANYALGFYLSGTEVDSSFYIGHLWAYVSGSLIYDNYLFADNFSHHSDIFYKLASYFCALPNMFIQKFGGEKIFPFEGQEMMPIGSLGEESNIFDAICYLFPSKGGIVDIFLFYIIIFLFGVLFSYLYYNHLKSKMYFDVFIVNLLCYFIFFSFYGTFYIHSGPWEILIWSLFFPRLFYKKKFLKNEIEIH